MPPASTVASADNNNNNDNDDNDDNNVPVGDTAEHDQPVGNNNDDGSTLSQHQTANNGSTSVSSAGAQAPLTTTDAASSAPTPMAIENKQSSASANGESSSAAAPAAAAVEAKAGTTATVHEGDVVPRRKRTRRGGWDTPANVVPKPVAAPTLVAPPVNPLQELQRKLAEEQVAAAMGQAPPVTSVAAGAVKMGLTMGVLQPPGARAPVILPSQAENPRRIYVGSLHYDLKESDLTSIFSAFGPLKLIDMSHDPATGRHKGFCFIEYVDIKGADNALAVMNGFELAGRPIKVGRPHSTAPVIAGGVDAMGLPAAMQLPGMAAFMAQRSAAQAAPGMPGDAVAAAQLKAAMASVTSPPQTKIYVGNVEPHITTEIITKIFQPFGQVVGAEMVQDPNNPGFHKGFGFIQYTQESVAKTAMETMANFELAGRCLRVAWAQDQSKPALSVLQQGLTPAAVAAQAAAAAAKAASGAAAAARMTAAGQLQAALAGAAGSGNGAGLGLGLGLGLGSGVTGGDGGVAAALAAATAAGAAQRAELVRRMLAEGVGGNVGLAAASRCICLMNMLGPEDVEDDEVKSDILEEARTCGMVEQFYVHQQRSPMGVVVALRVFVVYSNPSEAAAAMRKMQGRFFAGRQVRAVAYDHAMFSRGMLDA